MYFCSICGSQIPEEELEKHTSSCGAKPAQPAQTTSLIDFDGNLSEPDASKATAVAAATGPSLAGVVTASSTEEKKKKKGFFGSLFSSSSDSAPSSPLQSRESKSEPADPPQLARDYVKGAFVVHIVDQPQKTKLITGIEAMTYRISAKSSLAEYSQKPLMQVRRTFADFQNLHKHVVRLHPHCIVPPITDRKRMMVDDTTPVFLAARSRHLQRLLNRLGVHPVLAKCEPLMVFLQGEDKDWKDAVSKMDIEEKDILTRTPKKGWFGSAAPTEFSKEEGAAINSLRAFGLEAKELETEFRNLAAYAKAVVAKRTEIATTMTTIGKDYDKILASKSVVGGQSAVNHAQLINCVSSLMTTWIQVVANEEKMGETETDGLYECLKEWFARG